MRNLLVNKTTRNIHVTHPLGETFCERSSAVIVVVGEPLAFETTQFFVTEDGIIGDDV